MVQPVGGTLVQLMPLLAGALKLLQIATLIEGMRISLMFKIVRRRLNNHGLRRHEVSLGRQAETPYLGRLDRLSMMVTVFVASPAHPQLLLVQ